MTARSVMPVLEVGGTHVTAALVETGSWNVAPGSLHRVAIDAQASAAELLNEMVSAAGSLSIDASLEWVVAVPSPFNYAAGIALFEHVGKFDNLFGIDLGKVLLERINPAPAGVRFLNDADAFGIGEYAVGAARGQERAVCITLGTGIGSAYLNRGTPVSTGSAVPPEGRAHRIHYLGGPLEGTVSRRAIRSSYAAAVGVAVHTAPDVKEIAERSRGGDGVAAEVLQDAFEHLGAALGPSIDRFGASVLVIGGSMARAWDIVEPAVRRGLSAAAPSLSALAILPAERPEDAALAGAAYWAAQPRG